MNQRILAICGVFGALGIAVGAFGAHALPNILSDLPADEIASRQDWLETGVKYHMYHVVAMLAVGLAGERGKPFVGSAVAWLVGILIFSGCLYAMTLTGIKVLGAVVPIGGVAFIVGWIMLLIGALRSPIN